MSPVFPAQRRAEEFNRQVERASAGQLTDARYAEFLEVVATLREAPPVTARPEFVSSLRERLMAAAPDILVAGQPTAEEARLTLPPRRPLRERRLAAAVGGLAIVGATTSMAVAAQSALPGDVLYPLKRAIENAQAGFSSDEADKGTTLLANATGRLDEVSELSRGGDLEDTAAIADTLNEFTEQATEASDLLLADYVNTGDESSINELRDFTATSMETLAELEPVIPSDARDELLHAAQVLNSIDAATTRVCPTCTGAGITDIPAILTAGYAEEGIVGLPELDDDAPSGSIGSGKGGKGTKDDEGSQDGGSLPDTDDDPLSTGGVLGSDGGSGSGSGGSGGEDPIDALADSLTGGEGDSEQTSNDTTELPDLGEVVDDLTDPLLNP